MGPIRNLSVLLVEDNPGDARLIETYLGNGNHERFSLLCVSRVSEALQAIEEIAPDAILLDLGLPDSQGIETLDRVAACCDGTPVIVLTGLDDEELALKAIRRGAQDYLPKGGFDERLLVRTVRYAVERARSEEAVRRSEERYRSLFEQANEAALVVVDETIRAVNPKAEELLERPASELASTRLADIVHCDDRDMVMERHRRRMRGENPPARYEFRVVTPDGGVRWVEVSTARVVWEESTASLSLLTDVTDRRLAEERTTRLLDRQTAINELTLALGGTTDAHEACRVLYRHVSHLVDAPYMHVATVSEDRTNFTPRFGVVDGRELDLSRSTPISLDVEGRGLLSRVVKSGEPLLVADYSAILSSDAYAYRVTEDGEAAPVTDPRDLADLDLRSAIIAPMRSEGEVTGTLHVQSVEANAFDEADVALVAGMANVAAIALRNAELVRESVRQARRLRNAFEGIVETVSTATEARDPYTAGHQQRVAQLAVAIAETLGLDADTVEGIRVAGTVHDIGKIGIPAEILSKPGKLTETEFQIIQAHSENAYKILESIDFPWPIAEVVYQHHERLDGSGYPRQLAGDEISLEARILAVADVVEAMASHRPYRPALGLDAALAEIESCKSTKLDTQAVEACLALFNERGYSLDVATHG